MPCRPPNRAGRLEGSVIRKPPICLATPSRGLARALARRSLGGHGRGLASCRSTARTRADAAAAGLFRSFPVDPGLDQILGEDVAAQQELVIRLERVDRFLERAWRGADAHLLHLVAAHL